MAVQLTAPAAERVRQFATAEQAIGLRFGVKKSGCSGFAYRVELARDIQPDDAVFEHPSGARVIVDAASLPYVDGTEIDFAQQGINRNFVFHNPKVTAECGCGESFSTEKTADF